MCITVARNTGDGEPLSFWWWDLELVRRAFAGHHTIQGSRLFILGTEVQDDAGGGLVGRQGLGGRLTPLLSVDTAGCSYLGQISTRRGEERRGYGSETGTSKARNKD